MKSGCSQGEENTDRNSVRTRVPRARGKRDAHPTMSDPVLDVSLFVLVRVAVSFGRQRVRCGGEVWCSTRLDGDKLRRGHAPVGRLHQLFLRRLNLPQDVIDFRGNVRVVLC